jgi:DNA-binding transcriptional LysR family regulator
MMRWELCCRNSRSCSQIKSGVDQFKQISTFVDVVGKGSLSAAARAEGVAPAMISRRLDALEARLGVKLLQRTTRKIALTHEGSAFLESCQRILADLENAEASVAERSAAASGYCPFRLRPALAACTWRRCCLPSWLSIAMSA